MTGAGSHPRAYIHLCPGPRLDQAWTVTSGMVAIVGEAETLTFPPGATWPGLDALPDDWLGDFQPSETLAVSDSQWQRAAPESLPAGVALVHPSCSAPARWRPGWIGWTAPGPGA